MERFGVNQPEPANIRMIQNTAVARSLTLTADCNARVLPSKCTSQRDSVPAAPVRPLVRCSERGTARVKIRALIVDGEALPRANLREMLAEIAEVEILGELSNGYEALSFIHERHPDVVFLETQMPEVSGVEVLRALSAGVRPAGRFCHRPRPICDRSF